MEKSYNPSIDDTQSFDTYEVTNPNATYNPTQKKPYESQYVQPFNLAYRNEGFKDNSTFNSNSNYQSRAESHENTVSDDTPIIHSENAPNGSFPPSEYYTTDTLPLNNTKSNSTLNDLPNERFYGYPTSSNDTLLQELKNRLPKSGKLPTPPPAPRTQDYSPGFIEKLENLHYTPEYHRTFSSPSGASDLLETNFDEPTPPKPKMRSKSEALLETNFDYMEPMPTNYPISEANRSKSQPLETAM